MSHDNRACDEWYDEWRKKVLVQGGTPEFGLAKVAACDTRRSLEIEIERLQQEIDDLNYMIANGEV